MLTFSKVKYQCLYGDEKKIVGSVRDITSYGWDIHTEDIDLIGSFFHLGLGGPAPVILEKKQPGLNYWKFWLYLAKAN